ncbi:MAG: hypothetical protein ACQETB_10945, partial [Halobacteriota archaeon]
LLTESLTRLETMDVRGRALNAKLAIAHLETLTESPAKGLDRWDEIGDDLEVLDPSYSVEPFERLVEACLSQNEAAAAIEWCERALAALDAIEADGLDRLREYLHDTVGELEDSIN